MKKDVAIELLNEQISKLEYLSYKDKDSWIAQTASYIKSFFGENTPEYKYIIGFVFYDVSYLPYTPRELQGYTNDRKPAAKTFLLNCIETIKIRGITKITKNFLYRISDTALWTLVSISIPGFLTIGAYFGNMYSDKQNIELRQEIKELRDSISSRAIPSFQNANPKPQTDTNKHAQEKINNHSRNKF